MVLTASMVALELLLILEVAGFAGRSANARVRYLRVLKVPRPSKAKGYDERRVGARRTQPKHKILRIRDGYPHHAKLRKWNAFGTVQYVN